MKNYALQLQVSERTIYSDLKKIEPYLFSLGYQIIKKSGAGIELKYCSEVPLNIENKDSIIMNTPERRDLILEKLLFQNETITFDELSEEFLVSKSSLVKDFQAIKQIYINNETAKIISTSSGTRLIGSEEELQKLFISYNEIFFSKVESMETEHDEKIIFLNHYYGKEIVSVCTNVLYSFIKKNATVIAEYYVLNILNALIVLVYRLANHNHHIGSSFNQNDRITEENASIILNDISKKIKFTPFSEDIKYFSKYLIANKFRIDSFENLDKSVVSFIKETSAVLGNDLTKDFELKKKLLQHFPSMIYRAKNNIRVNNPFISQIKKEFALVYSVVWLAASKIEEEFKCVVNQDEIGFLTIHIQSTIDRFQLNNRILVICSAGIASSGLVFNRLKKILPPSDTIEIFSLEPALKLNLNEFDVIVSAVSNKEFQSDKTIVVSPIITNEDLINISNFYHTITASKDEQLTGYFSFKELKKYVDEDLVFFNAEYNSKENVISDICERLLINGFVEEGFRESILSREELSSTDLPNGVAIPHANIRFVKKTVVVFVVNKYAVKWGHYPVKGIIMICIAEKNMNDAKGLLSDIYKLIKEKATIEEILFDSTKQNFLNMIM